MTSEHTSGSSKLDEILAEYLQRAEAGEAVDRDELLRQHPEFADELRAFLADDSQWKRVAGAPDSQAPDPYNTPTLDSSPRPASDAQLAPTFDSEAPPAAPAPDTQRVGYFGDYELLEEIARGGMGVVYKARQVNLNRIVALKMILAGQLASEADVKRFHAEAEAAAALDHPNIVPIFEVGEHEGQHFFSMGYVEGESLAARVKDGPLPPNEAAALVKTIAEAIHYAHTKGVIHRDLKPANVLLEKSRESRAKSRKSRESSDKSRKQENVRDSSGSGPSTLDPGLSRSRPCITDFGLAKKLEDDSGLTATGQILGTPAYMPPEQAAGKQDLVGPASDIYSLGAILYVCLTGRAPFVADSPVETLMQVMRKEPVSPRELNPSVPKDLEMICLKCLNKRPEERYSTAQELTDDLARFQGGEPVQARPLPTLTRWYRWSDRNIGKFTAIAIVVTVSLPILIFVGLGFLFGSWPWPLLYVGYGLMLVMSAPYILMMLLTSVKAKLRPQTGVHRERSAPVSRGMIATGCLLITAAVGGYIYLLIRHGLDVPQNARFLPILAIIGIGAIIRGLGFRG